MVNKDHWWYSLLSKQMQKLTSLNCPYQHLPQTQPYLLPFQGKEPTPFPSARRHLFPRPRYYDFTKGVEVRNATNGTLRNPQPSRCPGFPVGPFLREAVKKPKGFWRFWLNSLGNCLLILSISKPPQDTLPWIVDVINMWTSFMLIFCWRPGGGVSWCDTMTSSQYRKWAVDSLFSRIPA